MSWSIGTSTGCCTERSILEVLGSIHEAGIPGTELGTPPRHFDPWQRSQVEALRTRLTELGIAPISIHAPFGGLLDLADPNEHHRRAAIGAILMAASALKEVGGTIVVVHSSDVPRAGQDVDHRLAHCASALGELTDSCRAMGMTLVVESPLPHLIGGHPDELDWILRRLDRAAGVCLDTGHATLGHHWDRLLTVAGDRLMHVHANDHHGQFDDHLPPGDGIIDWNKIVADLRRVDFRGWIMLELKCVEGALAPHLVRARDQLSKFLA